jgi:WD40 repeat protein
LVSGSYDCEVKLWSIETQDEIATLRGHSKEITSVAFSADGLYIASGSYDNTIEVWNIAALVPLK